MNRVNYEATLWYFVCDVRMTIVPEDDYLLKYYDLAVTFLENNDFHNIKKLAKYLISKDILEGKNIDDFPYEVRDE